MFFKVTGVLVGVLLLASFAYAGPLDVVEEEDAYVGDLVNKTVVITDNADAIDIDSDADRDKIRREMATRTIEYANEFVENFDVDDLASRLAEIFPEEYVNDFPDHIMKFIGSLDSIELDDYFASVDNVEKDDLDRIKMAYVVKSLAEHAPPPGGNEGHGEVIEIDVPGITREEEIEVVVIGDQDFLDKMAEYEDGFTEAYKYQVPKSHATDKEREESDGEGAIEECTDNFEEQIANMVKLAQMKDGLDNSRTSNWWRNLQGAGVEQCEGEDDGNKTFNGNDQFGSDAYQDDDGIWWRVKGDWWVHRHEDGTIRSFAQEEVDGFDPYRPPALVSGAQLLSTELKIFESDDALSCDMGKFRELVCNAEQKVLYIDYEHFPKGMKPGKISEGLWGYSEDGKPIEVSWYDPSIATPEQLAEGLRMDTHILPDGTEAPAPEEVIVDSDHPRGNTADGSGNWDLMVVRGIYWKDIRIPIYEYDMSYAVSYPDTEDPDEENAPKVKTEDVVLRMEKEVDAYDTPPDLITYIVPPLLEAPLPPTTYTRNEYPLGVSYSGSGGN